MKFQLTKAENPKAGDIRYKYPFAIIPTLCEDGWVVWLERYQIKEEYKESLSFYDLPTGEVIKWWDLVSKHALKDDNDIP